jgi:hypothetical protein
MIRIRDAEGVVLAASMHLGVIVERCAAHPVERCDIWPRDHGPTTVGVVWEDESFALMDLATEREARAWIQQHPALRAALREHPAPAPGVVAPAAHPQGVVADDLARSKIL